MAGNALSALAAPAPLRRRRRESEVFVVMSVPLFTAGRCCADLLGTVRQFGSTGPGLRRQWARVDLAWQRCKAEPGGPSSTPPGGALQALSAPGSAAASARDRGGR